jgi:hypothetical protein
MLDELFETKGYWKLKEELLERSLWTASFRSSGPVVIKDSRMINDVYSKLLTKTKQSKSSYRAETA